MIAQKLKNGTNISVRETLYNGAKTLNDLVLVLLFENKCCSGTRGLGP